MKTKRIAGWAVGLGAAMKKRRIAGWAVGLGAALVIAGLSQVPYAPRGPAEGLLRLSWRHRTEAQQICRPRTDAELEALPVHMRTPEVCERRAVSYRLTVSLDDVLADSLTIVSGGARGDRPVFVFREIELPLTATAVRVRFESLTDGGATAPLTLDTVLAGSRTGVELVTVDGSGRSLIVVSSRAN